MRTIYFIIWEFRVQKSSEKEFERVYGPDGDWAGFFSSGEGYLGTVLFSNVAEPGVYLTIDKWTSKEAYDRFRTVRRSEYEELDRKCETLTASEKMLGSFAQQ